MNYKISHHNGVCVISLSGNISRSDREQLLKCAQEVKKINFNSALLYFQSVDVIEASIYRELTLLQHEIRQKNDRLHLIGLKPALKTALAERGVIRGSELVSDLKDILPKEKGPA